MTKNERDSFNEKWFVREDFLPEQFPERWTCGFCIKMKEVGNCFDNREEAVAFANSIRSLINAPAIR